MVTSIDNSRCEPATKEDRPSELAALLRNIRVMMGLTLVLQFLILVIVATQSP